MEQFFLNNSDFILKLILAMLLGMLIGIERVFVHKEAGMKTHALVCTGAALFIVISEFLAQQYAGFSGFNPALIASNIIVGIGFLGAGSIIFQNNRLSGLTTAAGFWITAGIGMAVGFGLFYLAIFATILVLMIFILLNILEKPIRRLSGDKSE